MTKIRKLYYFDKKNVEDMISFLNDGDSYLNRIIFNPFVLLHYLLPLKFKFIPESYVLKDNKYLKGLITVAPSKNPAKQMEIQKLLFEENCYEDAGELIQYVVSKYKAMGTSSVIVRIDDYLPELIKLFVSKCGFSQISYEKMWAVNEMNMDKHEFNPKNYREFRNTDSSVIATMYNEYLLPHFRPLLGKDTKDFKDIFFTGLSYFSEYKYVRRDVKTKNINTYLSIRTVDNENYVLDIIRSSWEEVDINELISFAYSKIKKRRKDAKLFMVTKKYTHNGEQFEKEFIAKHFECIQNKIVLTNSSASIIKDEERTKKFTVLGQFMGGVSVANKIRM